MQKSIRQCRAQAGSLDPRSDSDFMIVPVVALIGNSVLSTLPHGRPELVPESEVQACVNQWVGVPVTFDHPMEESGYRAAGRDDIIIGEVIESYLSDGRLNLTAKIDLGLVKSKQNSRIDAVVEAIKNGTMVEVSIGASSFVFNRSGTSGGKDFVGVWSDIQPDHLAILPIGSKGACSNDMGCGVPRAARKTTTGDSDMIGRLKRFFNIASLSDSSLQAKIEEALAETLKKLKGQDWRGFFWIEEVFQEEATVIYVVGSGDLSEYFAVAYTRDGDDVEITGDPVQVEPRLIWIEPIGDNVVAPTLVRIATNPLTTDTATLTTDRSTQMPNSQPATQAATGEPKASVGRLEVVVSQAPAPQTGKADGAGQAAQTVAAQAVDTNVAAPVGQVTASPAPCQPQTAADQRLAAMTADERTAVLASYDAGLAEERAKRADLLARLPVELPTDELSTLSTSALEKLVNNLPDNKVATSGSNTPSIAPQADFSGRTVSAAASDTLPDTYGLNKPSN